ncbi:hypothetical protein ANHYDRO_00063 [Anaerococcus hydrogenalis DSM 7454]|uniref:Uncharacterized protein n=1 Tax=Anaerococcus hydrogenalis DSM 7454 TaxID=561177 RepID=B6W683_9FIRM|nr:hypothetical protein ANHYDRO_00063 [Anaerococcus hydrogenalis DSM 7454]
MELAPSYNTVSRQKPAPYNLLPFYAFIIFLLFIHFHIPFSLKFL